jgi:hypothetical protein
MSKVVAFKMLTGSLYVGKLVEDSTDYAHIPNAIVLDDTLELVFETIDAGNGQKQIQPSLRPIDILVAQGGDSGCRIALGQGMGFQIELPEQFERGYLSATSGIVLASSIGR